jgi:hypothetical protein
MAAYFLFFKKTFITIPPVLYGSELKEVLQGEKSLYSLELTALKPIHQLILEEKFHTLAEGQLEKSLFEFTDLINKNPKDISLKLYIISRIFDRIELGLGDDNTTSFINQWFPLNTANLTNSNTDILFNLLQARYELSLNNIEAAKKHISKIILKAPSEGSSYLYLAKIYLKECQLDSARSTIPLAISLLQNKRSKAYNTLNEIFIKKNQLDTAKLLIRSTLNRFPADLETHITALRFYNIDQFDEYQKELDKLRLLYSDDNHLQAKLLDLDFIKLSKCTEKSVVSSPLASIQHLTSLLDSLIQAEPKNKALKIIKATLESNTLQSKKSTIDSSSRSVNQPDFALQVSIEDKRIKKTQKKMSNNARLLQYLIHWKTQPDKFFMKYNSSSFSTQDSARFLETWTDSDSITHKQFMYFDNKGLWKMTGLLERPASSTQDLLGLVLKERARDAGDPIPTDASICPGFRNFNGYLWQHLDMIELVAQFEGRENQVRLLRIDPLRYPEAMSVCEYLKEILPNTSN